MTLSVLSTDNKLSTLTGKISETPLSGAATYFVLDDVKNGIQLRFIRNDIYPLYIDIRAYDSLSLVAAKLELGPIQTLAHKEGDTWVLNDPPPNYALELAKCQRYQIELVDPLSNGSPGVGFANSETMAIVSVPLPTTLRCPPTVSYKGTWYIERAGETGSNGKSVTDVKMAGLSKNILKLHITTSGLTPGECVILHERGGTSLFFDSNL